MYSHMQLSEIRGVNTQYTCLLQKDERLVWRKKVTHIQGEKGELPSGWRIIPFKSEGTDPETYSRSESVGEGAR